MHAQLPASFLGVSCFRHLPGRAVPNATLAFGCSLRSTVSQRFACSTAGIVVGTVLRVLGSSKADVQAVQNAKDLPGLAGFDHEELRSMRRRRTHAATASSSLPSGAIVTRWRGVNAQAV